MPSSKSPSKHNPSCEPQMIDSVHHGTKIAPVSPVCREPGSPVFHQLPGRGPKAYGARTCHGCPRPRPWARTSCALRSSTRRLRRCGETATGEQQQAAAALVSCQIVGFDTFMLSAIARTRRRVCSGDPSSAPAGAFPHDVSGMHSGLALFVIWIPRPESTGKASRDDRFPVFQSQMKDFIVGSIGRIRSLSSTSDTRNWDESQPCARLISAT